MNLAAPTQASSPQPSSLSATATADSVLVYLPQLKVGGAEISLLRLALELRERGLQVSIAVHRIDAEARALAGDLDLVSLAAGRTLTAVYKLTVLLRKRKPKFLVSALTHSNIIATLAARCPGVATRVVVTEHAPMSSMLWLYPGPRYRAIYKLMPLVYRLADAIVAVSEGIRADFAPALGAAARGKFTVIHNPVLRHDWQALAQEPVDDPWFKAGVPPVILSVGRLNPEKNFTMLIRAFAALPAKAPPARLAIIGEGPERVALQALIEALHLGARVRLLGQIDNPFAYMRRARLFVLTSHFEGFGNVLIEAMACGLPVISTDCPVGPREILSGGRYGTLIPVDALLALSEAIQTQLQRNDPPAQAMARAQEFTAERSVDGYLALFAKISRSQTAQA